MPQSKVYDSPATDPESAGAPLGILKPVVRHLGNSKVQICTREAFRPLGKLRSAPSTPWETVLHTATIIETKCHGFRICSTGSVENSDEPQKQ